MTDADKLNKLEVSNARMEERLSGVQTDMAGTRHTVDDLKNKVEALSKSIMQVGLAIVGAFILMLLSVLGYFIAQKDAVIEQSRHVERTP